jgi:hypothetical protein
MLDKTYILFSTAAMLYASFIKAKGLINQWHYSECNRQNTALHGMVDFIEPG